MSYVVVSMREFTDAQKKLEWDTPLDNDGFVKEFGQLFARYVCHELLKIREEELRAAVGGDVPAPKDQYAIEVPKWVPDCIVNMVALAYGHEESWPHTVLISNADKRLLIVARTPYVCHTGRGGLGAESDTNDTTIAVMAGGDDEGDLDSPHHGGGYSLLVAAPPGALAAS